MEATETPVGAIPAPSGITPHISDGRPSSLRTLMLAVLAFEIAIPSILVILRFYIRGVLQKRWHLSDAFIFVGYSFFIALCGMAIALSGYGAGTPGWDLAPEIFTAFAKEIIYIPANYFTKAAIAHQFIEIFVAKKRNSRWWTLWAYIIVNFFLFSVFLFLEVFQCTPREKIWDPSVSGSCIDIQATFPVTASINVVDDFVILTLPIIWIVKLRLPARKKLRVWAVFAVGVFALVCSILRFVESVLSVSNTNITVSLIPVALWAYAEIAVGLVVANLPYLPRLFRKSSSGDFKYGISGNMQAGHGYGSHGRRTMAAPGKTTNYTELSYVVMAGDNEGMKRLNNTSFTSTAASAGSSFEPVSHSGISKTIVIEQKSGFD